MTQQCQICEGNAGKEILACKIPQARIIGTDETNCLINLFRKTEKEVKSCRHKVSYDINDMLVKLHQDNAWLFMFQYPQKLLAQCKEALRTYQLENTGILKLTEDCRFSIKSYELPYIKNKNFTINVHQTEREELPQLPIQITAWTKKDTNRSKGQLKMAQHSDFHQILKTGMKDLDELEQEVKRSETFELPIKIQGHTNTLLIIAIIIILISLGLYIRHVKRKNFKESRVQSPEIIVMPTLNSVSEHTNASVQEYRKKRPQTNPPSIPIKIKKQSVSEMKLRF